MVRSNPNVILSTAISLDGKIGKKNKKIVLSSKLDKIRVHKLRSKHDAILIGKNTVKQDNPLLSVRYVKGKNPIRVILDSHGEITNNSKIIKTSKKISTIIVTTKSISQRNLSRLNNLPVEVIICGTNQVNLKKLLPILYKKGIRKILLEGGGTTNLSFLKNNLIDEIIITVTPFILGTFNSINLFEGNFDYKNNINKFKLKQMQKNNNEVILHYKR
tara:strand:+ start:1831 stop:2481 length:651 start_codon:yes stop_codon:yes gene_type:complete